MHWEDIKGTNFKIIIKRDLDKNWDKANPIIRKNELLCVVCTEKGALINKYKIGDGKTRYKDLNFLDKIPEVFNVGGININLDGATILKNLHIKGEHNYE